MAVNARTEEFQHIEVFDKPALFTNGRIARDTVPKGLAGHGFRALAEAMAADLPYKVDCPALLLCGERDRAGLTRRYNRRWSEETGIPLVWLQSAGHNSNTDVPDQVNSIIQGFLREHGL